ncbi:hydroxymethylbilane synthase [Desulfohalobium retbaense]|uniref:Porphobilinogen deaminase n=1 Tax=Desulfohalobium retbaense (strain ATCC 49708 / DSM 5692 / JCM 16813 / HR100) TaxID=485915 RepID=C8X0N3_DESRD|nr:hydroxymethylbilane synthase [Desulfohalobium retbaense]ACV67980.1 porphobilinogen deaminase [Desulfohalobium retbaense DSM 5692]
MRSLTIATRGSKLALWQANHIKGRLEERYPGIEVHLEVIKTQGDKILDVPLAKIGGKALFVKEIEEAMLDGRADLAVHSMKDVPAELPEGLTLGVIPQREDYTDCLLSQHYTTLEEIPEGATIGTSSLRRKTQLLRLRPDLVIQDLRGNLDTRIRKLEEGMFDAIVVASAGLRRLQTGARYMTELAPPQFLPAVGQGALGIEYPEDRKDLEEMLGFLDHPPTRFCVLTERAFLHRLEGGCQVPIGGHAVMSESNKLHLDCFVADLHGQQCLRREGEAKPKDGVALGQRLADDILASGGAEILREIYACDDE